MLQKKREKYAQDKKRMLTDEGTRGPPSNIVKDKGKAKISPSGESHISRQTYGNSHKGIVIRDMATEDSPSSSYARLQIPGSTMLIHCDDEDPTIPTQSTQSYEQNDLATPSRRRKRNERNRDDKVTCVDEIERFQSARWISASKAMWRIYRFTMNDMRPSVQSLQLHLEDLYIDVVTDDPITNVQDTIYTKLGMQLHRRNHHPIF